ncbi:hypothetical protein AKO1_011123 [Acrasis kona]|uniref:Lipid-binding serum glycoprotein N-terminal domain-containing protein n=1 Tax=Acrasis kona TaxID=1008807 RepID=A0AAW2YXT0_9EUKA
MMNINTLFGILAVICVSVTLSLSTPQARDDGSPFLAGRLFKQLVHNIKIPDVKKETKMSFGTVGINITNIKLKHFDLLWRNSGSQSWLEYPINLTLATKATIDWRYEINMILQTQDEGHLNLEDVIIHLDLAVKLDTNGIPKIELTPYNVAMHNVSMKIHSKGMSRVASGILNKVVDVVSISLRTQIERTLLDKVSGVCQVLQGVLTMVMRVFVVLLSAVIILFVMKRAYNNNVVAQGLNQKIKIH